MPLYTPVLTDHIFVANGVVFQDRFYCISSPFSDIGDRMITAGLKGSSNMLWVGTRQEKTLVKWLKKLVYLSQSAHNISQPFYNNPLTFSQSWVPDQTYYAYTHILFVSPKNMKKLNRKILKHCDVKTLCDAFSVTQPNVMFASSRKL